MKKLFLAALLVPALLCVALASGGKRQDTSRTDAIWDAVEARMYSETDTWFDNGDYPRTTQLLRFMAVSDASDYLANSNLGWMQENMKLWDEALATYVRFRKENPGMPDAPFPEANFYFAKKLYSKVPPLLQPTIGSKPHPNSYRILAHAYERLGLYPDAEKVWQQLLAAHPEDLAAHGNLDRVRKRIASQSGGAK